MKGLKYINIIFHIIGLGIFILSSWTIIYVVIIYSYDFINLEDYYTPEELEQYQTLVNQLNSIIPITIILLIIGIVVMIIPTIILKISNRNLDKKLMWKDINFKDALVGMSRVDNKINLLEISSKMSIKIKLLKNKILDLIKTGKINAQIDGNSLIPIGDEVEMVDNLLNQLGPIR